MTKRKEVLNYSRQFKGKGETSHGFYNSGGKHYTRRGNIKTPACRLWENIRIRCDILSKKERFKNYREVIVCEEWKDFQVFAEWFEEATKSIYYKQGWELDKDILSPKDIKIYSPQTCCFIPSEINRSIQTSKNKRGEFPIGVCKQSNGISVRYECVDERFIVNKYLSKDRVEEAFLMYKVAKEGYVKTLAEKYAQNLDPRVYEYLMNYEVNIDD